MINREKIKIYENEYRYVQWFKGKNFSGSKKSVVIVMHDGESIFLSPKDDQFNNIGWKMHETMAKLNIDDFLIFGYENAGIGRIGEYSTSEVDQENKYAAKLILNTGKINNTPRGKQYLIEGVFGNLIPHFEKKLNFQFNNCYKVMIGSSMGGQITTYCAVEHPTSFDAFISMSTCLHFNNSKAKEYIFSKTIKARYYHDMGGKEFSGGRNDQSDYKKTYEQICKWLESQENANYMSVFDSTAKHTQDAWKERMLLAIPWAIRKNDI